MLTPYNYLCTCGEGLELKTIFELEPFSKIRKCLAGIQTHDICKKACVARIGSIVKKNYYTSQETKTNYNIKCSPRHLLCR